MSDKHGRTALLILATEAFAPNSVDLLLEAGADVEASAEKFVKEYAYLVRLLLERGADLEVRDKHGRTALKVATSKGKFKR